MNPTNNQSNPPIQQLRRDDSYPVQITKIDSPPNQRNLNIPNISPITFQQPPGTISSTTTPVPASIEIIKQPSMLKSEQSALQQSTFKHFSKQYGEIVAKTEMPNITSSNTKAEIISTVPTRTTALTTDVPSILNVNLTISPSVVSTRPHSVHQSAIPLPNSKNIESVSTVITPFSLDNVTARMKTSSTDKPCTNKEKLETQVTKPVIIPASVQTKSSNQKSKQLFLSNESSHGAPKQKTVPKELAKGQTIPLYKGCKYRVSKTELLNIYTPHIALYSVRLAELLFGKETLDSVAKASKTNALDMLDSDKLAAFISKFAL